MRGSGDRANVPIKQADWALFHCGKNNLSHNRLQSDSTRCNSLIILIKTPQLHKPPCFHSLLLVWHFYDELRIYSWGCLFSVCMCVHVCTGMKSNVVFFKVIFFGKLQFLFSMSQLAVRAGNSCGSVASSFGLKINTLGSPG